MLKKFIFKTFIFLSPIVAILICMEIILRVIPNDYSYKRKILLENAQDIDILVLGSSQFLRGFDPEFLSMNGFNLANSGESLDYTYKMLQKYGEKLSNLKVVVIPISYITLRFSLDKDNEYWRAKNYSLYYKIFVPGHHLELLTGTMFSNIKRLLKGLYNFATCNKNNLITVTKLGFAKSTMTNTTDFFMESGKERTEYHNKIVESNQFFENNKEMLNNIINYCETNNLILMIITTPSYYTYRDNINTHVYNQDIQYITDLVSNYDFVHYYNYFDDPEFIQTDFQDADHLNSWGAEKLTKKVDADIRQLINISSVEQKSDEDNL